MVARWRAAADLVGALGMVLLLGFIALRLLSAAIFSLLYLLLAPGMVLAPALGEGGRAIFRRWAGQLLGAVVSKLLFSFLLAWCWRCWRSSPACRRSAGGPSGC